MYDAMSPRNTQKARKAMHNVKQCGEREKPLISQSACSFLRVEWGEGQGEVEKLDAKNQTSREDGRTGASLRVFA